MAQLVARILGKDEVTGSNPVSSSTPAKTQCFRGFSLFLCVPQAASFFATILGRDEAYYGTQNCDEFQK